MKAVAEEERAVQVGISFSRDLLSKIDELRKYEDRSHFVCRMLKEYFLVKPWIIHDALKREKMGKE